MARLYADGECYEQLAPDALNETEWSDKILAHASGAYPEYHVVPFKQTIESSEGTAIPDMAFIAKGYDDWFIVEVEMEAHSFEHVERQVAVWADASYGKAQAEYFVKKNSGLALDVDRLTSLFETQPPKILVIANAAPSDWHTRLRVYNAGVATFEVYRIVAGKEIKEICRIAGAYPSLDAAVLSNGSTDPIVVRYLRIETPDALPTTPRGTIMLRYGDFLTEWRLVNTGIQVYLEPLSHSSIKPGNYEIVQQRDGSLVLRKPIVVLKD